MEGPGIVYQKVKVYNYFSYGDCSTKAKKLAIRDSGYKFILDEYIKIPLKHYEMKTLKPNAHKIRDADIQAQREKAEKATGKLWTESILAKAIANHCFGGEAFLPGGNKPALGNDPLSLQQAPGEEEGGNGVKVFPKLPLKNPEIPL